jgi:thioredoxin-related protein
MKKLIIVSLLLTTYTLADAQDNQFKVYDPSVDELEQISKAVSEAKSANKHVLVQVGGNWCKWCRMFYKWSHETSAIDSLIKSDFISVHMNYSPENKNKDALKHLGYPQRFGFPVFLVLDGNGRVLHTQNTGYLEEGNGYSEKTVREFLLHWNRNALDEKNY